MSKILKFNKVLELIVLTIPKLIGSSDFVVPTAQSPFVLQGSGFFDLLEEFLSLVVLGIIFLSLAIWRYRKTT
jgi:hypothetical protein